jgi:hypothetical protein
MRPACRRLSSVVRRLSSVVRRLPSVSWPWATQSRREKSRRGGRRAAVEAAVTGESAKPQSMMLNHTRVG